MEKEKKTQTGRKKKTDWMFRMIILLASVTMVVSGAGLVTALLEYHEGNSEFDRLAEAAKRPAAEADKPSEDSGAKGEPGEGQEAQTGAAQGMDAEGETQAPIQEIDFGLLRSQNEDTMGWIEIPGTIIDYPVMHTGENQYYLNHLFSGEENRTGSIFIEGANHPDFEDAHTIIYGHNLNSGAMFTRIKRYRDREYFEEHPYFYLYTPEHTYKYEIFSCREVDQNSSLYTVWFEADESFADFVQELKEGSVYDMGVEVSAQDHIITLSTCASVDTNRFVVHAKRSEVLR